MFLKSQACASCWGMDNFCLYLFQVLLAGLRIKLTQDRLTGENKIQLHTYRDPTRKKKKRASQLIETYMPSGRKRGDRGLDFKGEEGSSTWRWKNKCLVNKCLLCYAERTQRGLRPPHPVKLPLPHLSPHSLSISLVAVLSRTRPFI